MRDFVDFQVCQSLKLRMAYSDKWDRATGGEAGRKLQYLSACNNDGIILAGFSPYSIYYRRRRSRGGGAPRGEGEKGKRGPVPGIGFLTLFRIDFVFLGGDRIFTM